MARKVDKLRPYRVDYFNHQEVAHGKALLRAEVARAVTAEAAKQQLAQPGRTIIRAWRFYGPLPRAKRVPIPKLFPGNAALPIFAHLGSGAFEPVRGGWCATSIRVGETLRVELPELPASGYRWHLSASPAEAVEILSDAFVKQGSAVGVAGARSWSIKLVSPVSVHFEARLAQPWSPEDVEEWADFTVRVQCPSCGIGVDSNNDGNCAICSSPAYKAARPQALAATLFSPHSSWQPVEGTNDLGNTPAAQAEMDSLAEQHDGWLAQQVAALGEFWDKATPAERWQKVGSVLGDMQGASSSFLSWDVLPDSFKETLAEALSREAEPPKHSDPFDAMMAMFQPPASGPDSAATKEVVADLNAMIGHDQHEQMMDNFVPEPGSRKWVGYPSAPTPADVGLGRPDAPRSPAYDTHTDPPEACAGCQAPESPIEFRIRLEEAAKEATAPIIAPGMGRLAGIICFAAGAVILGLSLAWMIFGFHK